MTASRSDRSVDRSRLPELRPVAPFIFPPIEKSTLPSGLTVWTIHHRQLPIVAFLLLVRHGAADDPRGKEGLAALTADMLDEGTGPWSAIEVHEELARIGAQLHTDIGADATLIGLTVLSRFSARGLRLLADIVVRPALKEVDVDRVRTLRLNRLIQLRDRPGALADRAFAALLYGEAPYGHTPLGRETSVAALTADDVRMFHRRAIRPGSATLVAVGDCQHATVHELARAAFSDWTSGSRSDPPMGSNGTLPRPARLNVVARAKAPQSELRIGHVAAARSTPDYYALVAANMVLGGQYVSRLNLNLRADKGITYGAHTAFDFRREPGPFVAQASVDTAATALAIRESMAEIAAIRGDRPASLDELRVGVAALTRGHARHFETAEQIGRAAVELALFDLADDYYSRFVPRMEGLTPADVTRVAAHHLDPARLTTLVVGDLDAIGQDLGRLNLGEPCVLAADTI